MNLLGKLANGGSVKEEKQSFEFVLGDDSVLWEIEEGLKTMKKGEKSLFRISPASTTNKNSNNNNNNSNNQKKRNSNNKDKDKGKSKEGEEIDNGGDHLQEEQDIEKEKGEDVLYEVELLEFKNVSKIETNVHLE